MEKSFSKPSFFKVNPSKQGRNSNQNSRVIWVLGNPEISQLTNYLENQLLLISINFTPKTSNPVALKKMVLS